jgi:hypothetical protein
VHRETGSDRRAHVLARDIGNYADLLPKLAIIHTLCQDFPNRVAVGTSTLRSFHHGLAKTWSGNVRHETTKAET